MLMDDPIGILFFKKYASAPQLKTLEHLLDLSRKGSWKNPMLDDDNANAKYLALFNSSFDDLFVNFKQNDAYVEMCDVIDVRDRVLPGEFDYFTKLGSGAFGLVLSCRHKLTGVMYAMKRST